MNAFPEIEDSILGTLFAHPEQSASFLAEHLSQGMLSLANGLIFAAFQRVFIASGKAGFVEIATELRESGNLDRIGGSSRLNDLSLLGGVPLTLEGSVKRLREAHAHRKFVAVIEDTQQAMNVPGTDVGSLLGSVMQALEAIASSRAVVAAPTTKALVMDAIGNLQRRVDGTDRGISTGLLSLDRLTGGIRPSSQWVIAGPAKGGKSSLALTFLASLAMKHKKRCAFFGLEMPSIENVERLIYHDTGISARAGRDGIIKDHEFPKLMESAGRIAAASLHFRDDCFELVEVLSAVRQLKAAFPDLFAVFVDYAQLVGAHKESENREREVATVSRGLRKMSMQTALAVILLSQTTDDGKLRESRALGMDATKIVLIDFTDKPGVRKLKLIQRDDVSGVELDVAYRGDNFKFADLADEYDHH